MKEHALLSASSSSRWLNCPPSTRLEEAVEEVTSEYAKEGIFAHALAELRLSLYLGNITKTQYNKDLKKMKKDEFYSEELDKYIGIYADFAVEKINEARAHTKDAIILIEMKLDYSNWVTEGFGTGDLVIIRDDVLEIIDLKYGKGVQVSAVDNSQMRLYGLGAINQFSCLYDINKVRMTIVQPRLDNISTEEIAFEDLLEWGEVVVKPKAELAYSGQGEFSPGEHCRFCKVKATCRARANENMKLACYDFKEPPLLCDEEVVEVLMIIKELQKWASDVEDYALNEAINNSKEWPGMKLVRGRSSRRYRSESEVAEKLLEAGYSEDLIYSKSILSLTKLEKTLGKKEFDEVIGFLIETPPGKIQLVPEDDKRPAIKSNVEEDFKN